MGSERVVQGADATVRQVSRAGPMRGLALGAAAVVALSACGGGSSSSSDTTVKPRSKKTATTVKRPTETTAGTDATDATDATTAPSITAGKGPADPCTLITKAEAETLAQTPLADAVKAGGTDDQLCQYVGPPTGPTAQVEIFSGAGAEKALQIDRDTLKHDFTTLAGIGDEAWEEDSNVFVRVGTNWAAINVVLLEVDQATIQSGLATLAATMASRM